jgi:uncharacterized membrane protein YGL010W
MILKISFVKIPKPGCLMGSYLRPTLSAALCLSSLTEERAMLGGRPWSEWIARYSQSHQHPVNRLCHTLGIPLIALSIPLGVAALFVRGLWPVPLTMFTLGWAFQFLGHAVEGKPPEFFHDWRFLFVGLRWWVAKIRGRA